LNRAAMAPAAVGLACPWGRALSLGVLALLHTPAARALKSRTWGTSGAEAVDGDAENCSGVLFAYFTKKLRVQFALSRDGQRFAALAGGGPIPELAAGELVRDPFVRQSPGTGHYHMVATNAGGFGGTPSILTWSSPDLLEWQPQRVVPIMQAYATSLSHLWAPEWIWDEQRQRHLIYFAVQWFPGHGHFDPRCSNKNQDRFAFWGVHTEDFQNFSEPFPLYDPHCYTDWYAGSSYGLGGIDGHILRLPEGGYRLFFKDSRAPEQTDVRTLQRTSGIRVASSTDLLRWDSAPSGAILGPWGVEGPELLKVRGAYHLYFDCTFWPKLGHTRTPYGMAVLSSSSAAADFERSSKWEVQRGSCTGDAPESVAFPEEATHGSFLCLSEGAWDRLVRKWG